METIAQQIKKYRKARGMTQKELGARIGVSGSAIMRYEKNTRQPDLATFQRIAEALEVPTKYLLGLDEEFEKQGAAFDGIVAILANIYGSAKCKIIKEPIPVICYYLIGEGEKQFILRYEDINTLQDFVEGLLPSMVDRLKDVRSEAEFIKEHEIVSNKIKDTSGNDQKPEEE